MASGQAGELPQDAKEMVTIASSNCERLVRLIGDILDLEKIEAGKMEFHFAPRDLRNLVGEAIELNKSYADGFGVTLTAHTGPAETFSQVDSDRILQVLTNLISNAVKSSPAGGTVKVEIEAQPKTWRLKVVDRGSGVPESFHNEVFSKFAQAEASMTRKKGGTGLGLSIVKMITERHGGRVGFTSEEGRETTFFVDLPRHEIARQLPTLERTSKKLLVCEGNAQAAESLSLALAKAGFQAVIATTPEQAFRLADETQFDAIAIDLSLPDNEAFGMLRENRSGTTHPFLPVVVISTHSKTIKILSQPVRIVDWQERPIDPERLMSALKDEKGGQHKAARILHIEDDPDVLHVSSAVLSEIGVVTSALSTRTAINELNRGILTLSYRTSISAPAPIAESSCFMTTVRRLLPRSPY